jgi:hypothetical protein
MPADRKESGICCRKFSRQRKIHETQYLYIFYVDWPDASDSIPSLKNVEVNAFGGQTTKEKQMANNITILDTIEVTDLEDNSKLTVVVRSCTELGNNNLPGLQVLYMGYIVNLEPLHVQRWAYQARKAGKDVFLLEDSWNVHQDQYIRNSLVLGNPLKVRVEVKTRSKSKPVVKEYPLPFTVPEE